MPEAPTPSHEAGQLPLVGGYHVHVLVSAAETVNPDAFRETLRRLDASAQVDAELSIRFRREGQPESTIAIDGPGEIACDVDSALSQTWDWPQAPHALGHATAMLSVAEVSEPPLADRYERMRRFNVVVRALLEHVKAVALVWEPAQRVVDPLGFIESLEHGGSVGDFCVNVRLFSIPDGRPGEQIMDTLGMTPFGLPDLQLHFTGLDPGRVAPLLLRYAEYLFDKGDVLEEDHLVRGIEAYEEWVCHREDALAPPVRPVIDIRPDEHGVPH